MIAKTFGRKTGKVLFEVYMRQLMARKLFFFGFSGGSLPEEDMCCTLNFKIGQSAINFPPELQYILTRLSKPMYVQLFCISLKQIINKYWQSSFHNFSNNFPEPAWWLVCVWKWHMLSQGAAAWVSILGKGFERRECELGTGCLEGHISMYGSLIQSLKWFLS